jgi:hypothetical protein
LSIRYKQALTDSKQVAIKVLNEADLFAHLFRFIDVCGPEIGVLIEARRHKLIQTFSNSIFELNKGEKDGSVIYARNARKAYLHQIAARKKFTPLKRPP